MTTPATIELYRDQLKEKFPCYFELCNDIRKRNRWTPEYAEEDGIVYNKKSFYSKLHMEDIAKTKQFIEYQRKSPKKIEECFALLMQNAEIEEKTIVGTYIPEKPISKKKKHSVDSEQYKNMKKIYEIVLEVIKENTPFETQLDITWQNYLFSLKIDFVCFLQCQRGLDIFY